MGRHDVTATVAATVSGHAVWHNACPCGLVDRGAEATIDQARQRVRESLGPHDTLTWTRLRPGRPVALWPDVALLRLPAAHLDLPAAMRGRGDVVAVDGSIRTFDRRSGWGVVTDAGWVLGGTWPYTTSTNALELLAIAHATRLFPSGHAVEVLSDNDGARRAGVAILSGEFRTFQSTPKWVPLDAFKILRSARSRGVRVTVTEVRTKTHPLHNVADRVARGLPVEPVLLAGGVHCG
ncbi:hypothetical protein [Saccharothrix texasensis]|uniref:hypothetical protein n=1 Tax=Saccharothrix texasensis TaxID=103734 RepID=UPI000F4D14F4|nr:hypothetical protein [Saccharothrix texasensis]